MNDGWGREIDYDGWKTRGPDWDDEDSDAAYDYELELEDLMDRYDRAESIAEAQIAGEYRDMNFFKNIFFGRIGGFASGGVFSGQTPAPVDNFAPTEVSVLKPAPGDEAIIPLHRVTITTTMITVTAKGVDPALAKKFSEEMDRQFLRAASYGNGDNFPNKDEEKYSKEPGEAWGAGIIKLPAT